ncbi:hypothetical protein [Jiangella alba]|uniref:Uncharacterized protein n=1 Tax=Jiangella alba TaxID=561176 RepID=A0A1H5P411_9ACTN|nr:hypothetical protein [Jiangella alba]SEF08344.1 hypothetical protein SAMN04488561_3627 [Jiangella alba]
MTTPEHQLFDQLVGPAWAGAEPIRASAPASEVSASRYRVRGLTEYGEPKVRRSHADPEVVFEEPGDEPAGHYTAVRGDGPDCLAVGCYRAATSGIGLAFVAVTDSRLAVLQLRDSSVEPMPDAGRLLKEGGGLLRTMGRLVKGFVREVSALNSIADRPESAVVEPAWEVPRHALSAATRWKKPLIPELRGGERNVQLTFTDGSFARLCTDEAGLASLAALGGAPRG